MKRDKVNILAWFLLFAFLLTTVGVNVSRIECRNCQMAYVKVHVFPHEAVSSCGENCACCHSCEKPQQSSCEHENSEHDFYKLSGDWAISHLEIQYSDLPYLNAREWYFSEIKILTGSVFDLLSLYIDTSRSREALCIFRC